MLFRKKKNIHIHTFSGIIRSVNQGVDFSSSEITISCLDESEKTFSAYLGRRQSELRLDGKNVNLYVIELNSNLTVACIFFWKSQTSMTLDLSQIFTKEEEKAIENQISYKIREELS